MNGPLVDLLAEQADTGFQAEMLSDWLQATEAIVWDRRGDGMKAQLRSRGFPPEELPQRLADLAVDAHAHLTGGERTVAILLTESELVALMHDRMVGAEDPLRVRLYEARRRMRAS